MIPTLNTAALPPAATLVNTSVPGSIALRPPSYSVAPSVSSAGIDTNARGSSGASVSPVQETAASPLSSPEFNLLRSSGGSGFTIGAQTSFFAQLIGQGGSQEADALLEVYEHLVRIGQVRYKPSDAQLPEPAPAGVFGKLLQQEKEQVTRVQAEPRVPTQPAPEQHSTQSVPIIVTLPRAQKPAPNLSRSYGSTQVAPPAQRASLAYTASIQRNNSSESPPLELA